MSFPLYIIPHLRILTLFYTIISKPIGIIHIAVIAIIIVVIFVININITIDTITIVIISMEAYLAGVLLTFQIITHTLRIAGPKMYNSDLFLSTTFLCFYLDS